MINFEENGRKAKIQRCSTIFYYLLITYNKNEFSHSNNQVFNRNYGLDLLKIFAMINIIILHINNSFLNLRVNKNNSKYKNIYLLEVFSFWPVNAFGLISGIVGYKKFKFMNILYIWFEYLFYSVFFSLYLYYKSLINFKILVLSLFPLGISRFWFVNAYILMYLFLPFTIKSFNLIDKNFFSKMIIFYLFIYSIYHILIEYIIGRTNYDFINRGYSSLWLIILYIIGAYIGIYYIKKQLFSNLIYLLIYILFSFITYFYLFYNIDKKGKPNHLLMEYYSPTIMIQALALIFFFSNLKINHKLVRKIILFLNPLNFNVSLIHLTFFRSNIITNIKLFLYIKQLDIRFLILKLYGISLITYLICAFMDYFRNLFFQLLKVKKFCNYIDKKVFN